MLIGINASKTSTKNRTGVENTVYQLIFNLKKLDKNNIYALYSNSPIPAELTNQLNFIGKYLPFPKFWSKIKLAHELAENKPDLYIEISYAIPRSAPKKSIAFVHDLAWKYFPGSYSFSEKLSQKSVLRTNIKRAAKIICISETTKKDLIKYFPESKSKAEVLYLAYDSEKFHANIKPRNVLKIEEPYILYVGRIEERKNVRRLVEAFKLVKKEKDIPHKLVIAGNPGHNGQNLIEEINQDGEINKDVILTGFVKDENLPDLYAGANIFAFPSLYEGFGIPILEAMACGIPVLTSESSSLSEIAGDAALLVKPTDTVDIAGGIYELIKNSELRKKLIKNGYDRVKLFSWEKSAKELLAIMEKM